MKTTLKTITLLASAALFTLTSLSAVETDPVGYKTVTIKGNEGLTLLGVDFLKTPDYLGTFSGVSSNTITVSSVNFDALLDAGESYFVNVKSSQGTDAVGLNTSILSWEGSIITLLDDLSSVITVDSDVISIHSLPTIEDLFGNGENIILQSGTALNADLIFVSDPDSQSLLRVYYSTGGFAGIGWRAIGKGSQDYSNFPIYYSDGLLIFKKSAGDVDLTISGNVQMSATSTVIEEGYAPFNVIYPSGTTLGNSGLYDSENPTQSIAAGTATTADLVFLDSDEDGQLERYYYSTGGFAGAGWRQIGGGSADMTTVSIASGFSVFNRNGAITVKRTAAY